eukprot:GHVS01006128.1.p1 GENE.GHVS01006128.1~~GHVS01006128.1.p1  ORF type:complete len:331 (-),score=31.30 GHVS01006128.1:234-1226(-)
MSPRSNACLAIPAPHSIVSLNSGPIDLRPWRPAEPSRANRHTDKRGGAAGSELSENLQLRLLIHIMGDIHQPLHCIETFMTNLPDGDGGGSKIRIDPQGASKWPGIKTLHSLWDSAGGMYRGSWPSFTSQDAMKKAATLVSSYPRESFGDRLKGPLDGSDLEELVKDTHRVAMKYAYEDLSFSSYSEASPFRPSYCYIGRVRTLARQQITLGGYRLANVLKQVAAELQGNAQSRQMTPSADDRNSAGFPVGLVSSKTQISYARFPFESVGNTEIPKTPKSPITPEDLPVVEGLASESAQSPLQTEKQTDGGWTWRKVACSMWPLCRQQEL